MTPNVGIYLRISDDPNDTRQGVERQLDDARAICESRGWKSVQPPYEDNNYSAYKKKVVRPAFERMLKDLADGVLDGVVVYNLDRFMRQPRDLERAIEMYESRPGLLFASAQGDLDLETDDGQFFARLLVNVANKASADTSRRVERKHLDLAEKGVPVGGTRPFGWLKDKATLDEAEAAIARAGIDRVLDGLSPRALAKEWNDAGITTTRGKPWLGKTVRQYMLNPRLAGYRTHKGKVMLDGTGAPVLGKWTPLVTVDTFERLRTALTHEERRVHVPHKGQRRYLLTGVAQCGICGAVMYGNRRGSNTGLWYYVCNGETGHTLSASGPAVDSLIEEAVLTRLLEVGTVPVEAPEWAGRTRHDTIQQKIDELMTAYREGRLDSTFVFPSVTALKREREELELDQRVWLAANTGPSVVDVTRDDWDALHTDEKRALVETFFSAIVVRPPTRHSNRFDPARVEPVPRAAA